MKRVLVIGLLVSLMVGVLVAQEESVLSRVYKLYQEEKYDEAMKLVEKAIADEGETSRLLQAKFYLLRALDRPDEALEVALKREEMAERKSPWLCMDIVEVYAEKQDKKNVLHWLEEAVDRGYIGYTNLKTDEQYAFVRDDKTFRKLVKTIKKNIGLDQPANDFAVEMLSGKTFTLSEKKGKVVLVDFWATWCGPCREEMPEVKKLYETFHEKGFEIVGISLDKDLEKLESYIDEEGLNWQFSYSGKGWDDETAKMYGVNSIPSTWLVDKKGILRHFGLRGEELRKTVEALLAE